MPGFTVGPPYWRQPRSEAAPCQVRGCTKMGGLAAEFESSGSSGASLSCRPVGRCSPLPLQTPRGWCSEYHPCFAAAPPMGWQKWYQISVTLSALWNPTPPSHLEYASVSSFPLSILISKLYHHLILICSSLKAVYHINGSVYCWEYFPSTMICNPLISTSCTLLVHIQFNL